MLRRLAQADVQLVVIDHRVAEEKAGLAFAARSVRLGILWVAVELPDEVTRLCIQAVKPAVASREDDLHLAVDLGGGRVGPLAVDDLCTGEITLPNDLPGCLVDRKEAGRVWKRHGKFASAQICD